MNVFIFSNVKNLSNKREENQRKVYFSFSFFMRAGLVPNESQPRHEPASSQTRTVLVFYDNLPYTKENPQHLM